MLDTSGTQCAKLEEGKATYSKEPANRFVRRTPRGTQVVLY